MKTAEEWMSQMSGLNNPALLIVNRMAIREIQLDAMKEGMRRAAKITKQMITGGDCGHEGTTKAILSAAEELTEKNLTQ